MKIPFSPPDIGQEELKEVIDTLQSGWITTGPKTIEFARQIAQYVHTPQAVCLSSASACMELTLRLLGVGPGDEVITSAYTYTATASVVCHVGAKLVLCDTAKNSYEMDYDMLQALITERTKVIIAVDIAGVICDYERIFEVVQEKKRLFTANNMLQSVFNRIVVMADGAHAFGAMQKGKMCGEIADFTCYSFHAVKNLTTAEGGAVTWRKIEGLDHDWVYKQYMLMSLHGQTKDALAKTKPGKWECDIVVPYYKCNMTDIMASIGLAQLRRYDGMLERRHQIVDRYVEGLKGLNLEVLAHRGEYFQSSGHLLMTRLCGKDLVFRNRYIDKLAQRGVAANVHYKPLPMLTAYKKLGFSISDFQNAYSQYANEVTLPLYSRLTDKQVDYVISSVRNVVKEMGK